jgi:formylglycine-generating enzyme required for sulfatase activity
MVDLGNGVSMEFVRIPADSFVIGDPNGAPDERETAIARIEHSFWMAAKEVSNRQFRQFKPGHDSRFEHRSSWIFSEEYLGWPLNGAEQPVVRVSWREAVEFCRWLGERAGEDVALPTEAQWEYACRAGTDSPMSYGSTDVDFSPHGNMADASMRRLADEGWRPKAPDLVPRDDRFNDGALVTVAGGFYRPNRWGLYDMHGNAAEWTRTTYASYPYSDQDGRNGIEGDRKVVRGGSWRDRPRNCRSASRWAYSPWQEVFNVGFRPVIQVESRKVARTN